MDKGANEILMSTNKIKKENPDEDMKEFAETAMKELLGWYGYGSNRNERIAGSCLPQTRSNSPDASSPKTLENCGWCGKPVEEGKSLSSGPDVFCSELCFSQSRRANFKKNKTCDWCRHVRHTVSYVDFQDGASQLQFCSDKCLNQYKMHIFCRETRAHLEIHPHLLGEESSSGALITPDLWLKNCRSPESRSPSASPKSADNVSQTSPLPLISVAHPSKLMVTNKDINVNKKLRHNKVQKKFRKRCTSTYTTPSNKSSPSEFPQDLRMRQSPPIQNSEFRDDNFSKKFNPGIAPEHIRNSLFNLQQRFTTDPRLGNSHIYNPHPLLDRIPRSSDLLPPTTILIPYPLIIPVPLPIPIPIPMKNFPKFSESPNDDVKVSKGQDEDKLDDTSITNSSQGAKNENVQESQKSQGESEIGQNTPVRPLRRRKRIHDFRNKIISVKPKKSIAFT